MSTAFRLRSSGLPDLESIERFPEDFCFQLTAEESAGLRSQFATSKRVGGRGGRRYRALAFTEHGAIMAANVLSSPRAVEMSVHVVRAFVRLREILASHKELAKRLDELEARYDGQFKVVFDAIRQLMSPAEPQPRRKIEDRLRLSTARPRFEAVIAAPHDPRLALPFVVVVALVVLLLVAGPELSLSFK